MCVHTMRRREFFVESNNFSFAILLFYASWNPENLYFKISLISNRRARCLLEKFPLLYFFFVDSNTFCLILYIFLSSELSVHVCKDRHSWYAFNCMKKFCKRALGSSPSECIVSSHRQGHVFGQRCSTHTWRENVSC